MKYKYFNILLYVGITTSVAIMPFVLTNCKNNDTKKIKYLSELKKGDKLENAKACWADDWYEDFMALFNNNGDYYYDAYISLETETDEDWNEIQLYLKAGDENSIQFNNYSDSLIIFPLFYYYWYENDNLWIAVDVPITNPNTYTFEVSSDYWLDYNNDENEFIWPEEIKYTFWFEY